MNYTRNLLPEICFRLLTAVLLAASAVLDAQPTDAAAAEPVMLDVFTVSSATDQGYKASNAVGATRTNTPIADTPQSIGVFNDLFIEDTMSFNLTELTLYDPTFMPTQADKGTYLARGFTAASTATFVDGLPQRNTFGPNYTANVDRVEILKGPAAILYGQGPAGATINRVLKRAQAKQRTTLTTTASDDGTLRAHLDTTGPLALRIGGRPLAYRLNLAVQEGETFKLQSEDNEILFSPALHIPLGRHTDLDLNFTYDKTNLTGNFAHPVTGGVPGRVILTDSTALQVPIENSFGEPYDERPIEKTLTSYDLRHQFSGHLSFRSQYQFETYNAEISELFPQIGQYVITATSASIRRVYREQNTDMNADRTRNEFVADFATGPVHHKALAGFSFDE
ncbi:MAG TPA: TonB-dependent receptor plug domain-containing protein, partial [Opitutus sp.]|nr:TonB-dependent receptor plug domain-containing protein [Opitutus sp.]